MALGTWNKTKKIRFSVKVDLLPEREKDPLLLPYTHIRSSSTVDFILHLQYYQRCEFMIFKMWVESKFVLWQPPYYDWLKKMIRKFTFLKYSLFKNVLLLSISRNSLQTSSLDDTFGKFYIVKFNYFSERPSKVKERFWNIFDWRLCWWYWKQKYH